MKDQDRVDLHGASSDARTAFIFVNAAREEQIAVSTRPLYNPSERESEHADSPPKPPHAPDLSFHQIRKAKHIGPTPWLTDSSADTDDGEEVVLDGHDGDGAD